MPVRLGVAYNSPGPPDALMEFVERVERMGLDSIWVNENVHSTVAHWDPFVTLAAIAVHSRRVTIGTAVALLPLRQPVELARTAASLDALSGGRLVVGVAAGGGAPDGYGAYGVALAERGVRADEALEVITRLWSGEPVTWRGRFHALSEYAVGVRPVQRPGPPLWMGGRAEPVLRRAARWADGVLPIRRTAAECAALYQRVAGHASDFGRDPGAITRAVYLYLCVAESGAAARATAQAELEARYRYPVEFLQPGVTAALGSAQDCAATLADFAAAGAQHIILDLACPEEHKASQLEAVTDEVAPALRQLLRQEEP